MKSAMLFHSLVGRLALVVLVLIILASLMAPWIAPYDPLAVDMASRLQSFSLGHLLGTDSLGRDYLSRLLYGGRIAMLMSLAFVILPMMLGVLSGVVAGYCEGGADKIITGLTNIFLALPGLTLMVAVAGIMGPGLDTIAVALTLTGWTGFSRVVRAEVMQVKQHNYVEVARGMGSSHIHILKRHLFPSLVPICLVTFTTRISRAMIIISSLSFLGFGLEPPAPDWGGMIREDVYHFRTAPHLIMAPGLVIFLFTFSVNIIGDELRDYLHVD